MRSAIIEDGAVVNVIMGKIEGSIPCGEDVGIGWSHDGQTFAAPPVIEPEPQPALPKRYSKKALFEAMTDEEYETFELVEAQQTNRDRRIFREASELNEADQGFYQVQHLLSGTYGEARASELLKSAEF
ncbi:hypothetical protein VQ042_22385 [Aurantimonas sp. A2-1-M11]|uniref:hypothetical protein n=1 Tax=Aurantimonas sp. A2-1-M11 TaxID=3113712 RepID=UPI002F92B073